MSEDPSSSMSDRDLEPQAPREPEPWECCQSGCDPCIYDRYWEAMARYEQALREWRVGNAPKSER